MKITIFIGSLSNGGAERVACNLANYLSRKGHMVSLLLMSNTDNSYNLDEGISVNCLLDKNEKSGFILNNFKRIPRYLKYLRKKEMDAYVVMLPITNILLLSTRLFTNAKIIACERNNPANYPNYIQKLLRIFARNADSWVFQTEEQKKWYSSSISKENSVIIPNAINESFIMPLYNGPRKKIIICTGRLKPQKNHKLLIDSFSLIADKFPDYNLHIYGKGELQSSLETQIKDLNLCNRIFLLGYRQKIEDVIRESSLFVLSSDFEGMPNALIEAMALGVPCISTNSGGGGARYLIQDGVNGLLIPPQNCKELADAMEKVLSNDELSERLGKEAYNITKFLSPHKIYGLWEDHIISVISR